MALNYILNRYKDVYTLTNNESINLSYTVTKVTCSSSKVVFTGNIEPGQTGVINFKVDGNYTVTAYNENENAAPVEVKFYNNLCLSLIEAIEKTICGCTKCKDCDECNDCEDYLNVFMKVNAFAILNTPTYKAYLEQVPQQNICSFTDEVLCNILQEKVYGNASIKEVIIKLLSYYYIAFYYKDLFMAADQEEKAFVTAKYKFEKINKCMNKSNIASYEVITTFEQGSRVYFWQQNSPLLTLSTEALLINESYLASKPNLPYETFENGYKVTYELDDKIVFYIGPTQVGDFVIYDSLGNDITDEFDSQYIESTEGYLLVSKVPYSASQIYFKFKKQI